MESPFFVADPLSPLDLDPSVIVKEQEDDGCLDALLYDICQSEADQTMASLALAIEPQAASGLGITEEAQPGATSDMPASHSDQTEFSEESTSDIVPKVEPADELDILAFLPDSITEPGQPTSSRKRRARQARSSTRGSNTPDQDKKRQKFLERNRVAASKCRKKRKEQEAHLQEKQRSLERERRELDAQLSSISTELMDLVSQALTHKNCCDPNLQKWLVAYRASQREYEAIRQQHGLPNCGPLELTNIRMDLHMDIHANLRQPVPRGYSLHPCAPQPMHSHSHHPSMQYGVTPAAQPAARMGPSSNFSSPVQLGSPQNAQDLSAQQVQTMSMFPMQPSQFALNARSPLAEPSHFRNDSLASEFSSRPSSYAASNFNSAESSRRKSSTASNVSSILGTPDMSIYSAFPGGLPATPDKYEGDFEMSMFPELCFDSPLANFPTPD